MKKRKRKTTGSYFIFMICVMIGLISVILAAEYSYYGRLHNLSEGLKANPVNAEMNLDDADTMNKIMDFSVKLFQNSASNSDNTLISPISALNALAMAANGAEGNTKAQIEAALGLSVRELNEYVWLYRKALPESETCSLNLYNTVWLDSNKNMQIEPDFLQTIEDYIEAPVYEMPFDERTIESVNRQLSRETDGMIEDILPEVSDQAVMYFLNTMSFDSDWFQPFREGRTTDSTFTTEQGHVRNIRMMDSEEYRYISDEKAVGVMKYYIYSRYDFVALLPKEGISVEEYLSSLTGTGIMKMINQVENKTIILKFPRFQYQYSSELTEPLKNMGITEAFDSQQADFTGLGTIEDKNIYAEAVVQKTYIDVNESGTAAGAAALVELYESEGIIEEPVYLTFNRPFVYLILDHETNMPILMGTVMDIGE